MFLLPGSVLAILIAAALIAAMLAVQTQRCRTGMLLLMISTAVERRLPLAPVLAAYATDAGGTRLDKRGETLSKMLEQGAPLDEALALSGRPLGAIPGMLVSMGQHVDDVPAAMRRVTDAGVQYRGLWQAAIGRFCYLTSIVTFALMVVTFQMIRIVPSFEKIFTDFHLPLPIVTQMMITVANFLATSGTIMLVMLVILTAWLLAAVRYVGDISVELPILRRFALPYHSAAVLQALSLAAAKRRPLEGAIGLLAGVYPSGWVRRRLARAQASMEQGQDWIESLWGTGLLRRADSASLRSSQRAGNLAWAMQELSDAAMRRLVFRMQGLNNALFPLLLIFLALGLALFILGMTLPMVVLINSLT